MIHLIKIGIWFRHLDKKNIFGTKPKGFFTMWGISAIKPLGAGECCIAGNKQGCKELTSQFAEVADGN